MSTPEHPETPPLTRRQLRELRNTGATPIITPEGGVPVVDVPPVRDEPATGEASADAPSSEAPPSSAPHAAAAPSAPLARPAAPVSFAPPVSDAAMDFAGSGLTRRQARAQEKIRTASIPVVSHDLDAPAAPPAEPVARDDAPAETPSIFRPAFSDDEATDHVVNEATADAEPAAPQAVVNPELGSELLDGGAPEVALPPSFDQLIARSASATGSISTPNALILSQTPTGAPLVAPVTATGEILITGTFELPEGLGSVGHAPGTTDGRDADAVLIDGELPPASSPTPIAASAAISTVKQPGEIIRPPAPEKGSRLVLALAITAGALALTLVGFLVYALTTGIF